jgi:alkylhydroperoxidase/carboxymuconolactone decarboxylase family protein YurZ
MRTATGRGTIRSTVTVPADLTALGPADKLRLLAANDEAFLHAQIAAEPAAADPSGPLDERTRHLLRLAAFVALDATGTAYAHVVSDAMRAGSTPDEIVDALIALASTVGITRIVAASARLAAALGYSLDAAVEL